MGYCDKCSKEKKVRRLGTGGGSGIYLCDPCLKTEINWRKGRNKDLVKHYGSKKRAGKTLFRTRYKVKG